MTKKGIILLLIAILSCLAITSCASFTIKEGDEFLAAGQYEDAIRKYREATEIAPDNAHAHYKRGTANLKFGELTLAEANYRRAIRLNPDLPDPFPSLASHFYERGIAALESGDPSAAQQPKIDYLSAIRLNPNLANTAMESKIDAFLAENTAKYRVYIEAKREQDRVEAADREKGRLEKFEKAPTVKEIADQRNFNRVGFERLHFGRKVEVKGRLHSIQEDFRGEDVRIILRDGIETMDCYMEKKEHTNPEVNKSESELHALRKILLIGLQRDQIVSVEGTFGKSLFDSGLALYDCQISYVYYGN